ncbi:MAG: hypothetical protein JETT_1229 [Candidatus Jettenia ecosi]|uniref:Uncharacterized protein n=1 Tax=Candidatus Jettenia ecosi TaxID=2494326 RepID=A0A533QCL1_9BACT|nr:MAG: hypothetical protein JETT_1229 [Candidatus Jettenia ecosi]
MGILAEGVTRVKKKEILICKTFLAHHHNARNTRMNNVIKKMKSLQMDDK